MPAIEAVCWSPDGDAVRIIDQTLLPERFEERDLRTLEEICEAIELLRVRGAPAIGVAAGLGLVTSLLSCAELPPEELRARAREHAARLAATRPTAVNLSWALDRMLARLDAASGDARSLLGSMRTEANTLLEEDRAMCRRIGEHGLELIPDGARVLTHCNAGALATAGIGTALAPIYLAAERGREVRVYADETRPLLQGSRLTAWELERAGIPVKVIVDSAAGSMMAAGKVDLVIVGADRIAANGDAANKIGSYALAVLAARHGIPFYVAAPASTLDPSLENGSEIVIEQRPRREIAAGFGCTTMPEGVEVENPAFDVIPAELITAIVTDGGVHRAPFDFSLQERQKADSREQKAGTARVREAGLRVQGERR
ncbi:MAG TPA: S-methyl-5-thioribose-1-phosphate isomerase [Gemmatimonadaceae bacterium]|nr:S-methyl-5-thioribose-1-phosphate isomerase [Gemmatimonadaceae bacterium]